MEVIRIDAAWNHPIRNFISQVSLLGDGLYSWMACIDVMKQKCIKGKRT